MANDRRFLYEGNPDRAIGQVFDVAATPTQLIASGLGPDQSVRLQVLAGRNIRRAGEQQWTTFSDPNGVPVVMTGTRTYVLLIQPGTFRIHPDDVLALSEDARVWLEDATYRGTERIVYNTDVHGHTANEGGTEADSGAEVGNSTGADGDDLPELADETETVTLQIAHDSAASCVTYGFSADAQVLLRKGDTLYLSRGEYERLVLQFPYGPARFVVNEYFA